MGYLLPLSVVRHQIKKKSLLKVVKSVVYADDGTHKYKVILKDGRTVKFGSLGYPDTLYRSYNKYDREETRTRRRAYRERHATDNINDVYSPGFWSWHILW